MKPIQIISKDVFDKIRSRFSNLEMGDETGAVTIDPTEARFFDFDFVAEDVNLGRVSISLNDLGSLKVYYSQGITENLDADVKKKWYSFLREMRYFAMRRRLRFDTRDIAKTNLDKNDFQHLAATQGPKEQQPMKTVNESRWTPKSTAKTSRAVTGRTEVIVRHARPVEEYASARSQKNNIKAIFIQNASGERYKYPFIHPAGAFAMAQHVDHGGVPHDPAGKAIIKMSEEIAQLQEFQRKIQRASLHDDAMGITEKAVGRLNQLKEKMNSLGKKHHYECWMKEFTEVEHNDDAVLELDAVTMEDYKSKFTQRTFEEELTKYFPLLHSIMRETNKIELEDYVNEGHSSELEMKLHQMVQADKEEMISDGMAGDYGPDVQNYLTDMYNDIAYENRLHPDDDGEYIEDIMRHRLYDEYGDADISPADGDIGNEPEDKFEAWAEAVEQGKLTDDQIEVLRQEIGKLPMTDGGPQLELGADGQTAAQFFNQLGLEDSDLADKLKKAAEVDPQTNALEVFGVWAEKNYPELLVALGMSGAGEAQPAEMTQPATGAPGLSTVHGAMENDEGNMGAGMMSKEAHDPKDMIKEVAKIVKSFYNRDNPEVGPFRGHEGIAIDVEKTISEKFGEQAGQQARELAEKFMEKLTMEWQERHQKMAAVDQDDGLARLKELVNRVKGKVENLN